MDSSEEELNNVKNSKENTLAKPKIKTRQTKLFEITLEHIQKRSARDSEYLYNFGIIMKYVRTPLGFIQTIYKHSRPNPVGLRNETFWKLSNELCIGMGNAIILGAATTPISNRKRKLCPNQFGGKKQTRARSIGVRPLYAHLGKYGEEWVYNQLIRDNKYVEQPGKICKASFPLASTTPDYLFFTGNGDCPASSPINFEQGAVVAIGECKTSNIILPNPDSITPSDTVWHKEDATVRDIILAHKPTLIKNIFSFPESNALQKISWLGEKQCLATELEDQIKHTTKWYLKYYLEIDETGCRTDRTFDMSIPANQVFINCLSTDTGKQVLCEMLSVIEAVKADTIGAKVYFPSVTNKNCNKNKEDEEEKNDMKEEPSPCFLTMFNLYCTFDVSIRTLKGLDSIINENLETAMESVANLSS